MILKKKVDTIANLLFAVILVGLSCCVSFVSAVEQTDYESTSAGSISALVKNLPPIAEAGDDIYNDIPACVSNSVDVEGSYSDDAYPGTIISILWSQLSGPEVLTFSDVNSSKTSIKPNTTGEYLLSYSVSDGEFTSTDTLTLFVTYGPPPPPPTVNAGPDKTISLGFDADLEGFSHFGCGPSAAEWSGPPEVTFADKTAVLTSATFPSAGIYTLTLKNLQPNITDTMTVTVVDNVLANNQVVSDLSGLSGSEIRYRFPVPAYAKNLSFAITGEVGDADLYVSYEQDPVSGSRAGGDCVPYLYGSKETCEISPAKAGNYYLLIHAYQDYTDLTLTVQYDESDSLFLELPVTGDVYVGNKGRIKNVNNVYIDGNHLNEETRGLINAAASLSKLDGREILSVALYLNINNSSNNSFAVYLANGYWTESNVNWSSAELVGEPIANFTPNQLGYVSFDLGAGGIKMIQDRIQGYANYGLVIATLGGEDGMKFTSSNNQDTSIPKLKIEYK